MKINKVFIRVLVFNIAETILIFLIGRLLNLPINFIITIMLTFCISRGFFGKALHFKTWYRCLIWSSLILLSLFLILKIELKIAILFTIFTAFIMTGKSNINDMYLWKPSNKSKYSDIDDFMEENEGCISLINFENKLKLYDELLYIIYKYRFKEKLTFSDMSEKLEMANARIVEKLDQIALAFRINFEI